MMDPDIRRLIREEVKQQLNVILHGAAGANDQQTETISAMFPGGPDIPARPVMHPYGFASRAAAGTISIVAKVGNDMQNRMTLGHRDSKRPSMEVGEAVMYSLGQFQVRAQNDKVITGQIAGYQYQATSTALLVGKGGVLEPVVMGATAVEFFTALIQLIVKHTHIGNLGAKTSPPENAPDFVNLQSQNLDNNYILAEDGGRF